MMSVKRNDLLWYTWKYFGIGFFQFFILEKNVMKRSFAQLPDQHRTVLDKKYVEIFKSGSSTTKERI